MRVRSVVTCFLVGSQLIAASVLAQPPAQRGRGSDGRAFRIENGMRLTDYIAELEVTNDDLRRQLLAAEDELIDAQKQSTRSGKPQTALSEKDLISAPAHAPGSAPALPPAARSAAQSQAPVAVSDAACQSDLQALRAQYAALDRQLKTTLSASSSSSVAVLATRDDLAAEQSKRAELETRMSDLQRESDRQKITIASLQEELEAAKSSLVASREREEQLQNSRAKLSNAAVADAPASSLTRAEQPAETPREEVLDAAAFAAAKTELRSELQRIQSAIIERKNLLDSTKAKGRGISLTLQPLVTANGKSLDTLRAEVNALSPASNKVEIRSGIAQIAKVLNDDVATLKRLSH